MSFQFRLGVPIFLISSGTILMTACGGGRAPASAEAPTMVSGAPAEASGAEQTFALEFANPAGADKILMAQLMVAPNLSLHTRAA